MKRIFIITALALSIVALSVSCELNSRVTYYTVTFNSNGGSSVRTQKVEAGDSPIEPKDPTRGGYRFVEWEKEGEKYDFNAPVNADMTLTAKWEFLEYNVGDTGPAGGLIFYVSDTPHESSYTDENGKTVTYIWRYLEAAPEDITVEGDGDFVFGYCRDADGNNIACGAGADEIGSGRTNTRLLVNAMGDEAYTGKNDEKTSSYAAKLCDDYRKGGYDDWFLPSALELKEMYLKLRQSGKGGFSKESGRWYSSSTENGTGQSYVFSFYYDYDNGFVKKDRSEEMFIRAIRAF